MATITMEQNHSLGLDGARERVRGLVPTLIDKYGVEVDWQQLSARSGKLELDLGALPDCWLADHARREGQDHGVIVVEHVGSKQAVMPGTFLGRVVAVARDRCHLDEDIRLGIEQLNDSIRKHAASAEAKENES